MAELQHTQTRLEFTWLFLATPKHLPHVAPVVLRTNAATEEEARAEFSGWNMVFAAKIRSQMRCHITFFNDENRTGLTLEVEAVEGVFNA
ncbi:TPA: host cell division inhibitor Icd-like protein [Klebsiella pneumoniae]|uniref:host cell division inhibitor Icd-like protein n=1 Tax=Klebsiella pneumoniae TaxID=573 RepID=UPI000DE80C8B|nr:host cell division inhibitor Icd-like protein [Klebsiella pneumoniae]ELI8806241.1 host cell division inhibitor Icd-like protein [Klebsiella michiganensis]MCE0317894.1 host cell division inhibitor Icd-like protein [Klebsiella pneumoniae]RBQ50067.1 host cell division inhibitor Icd-like protein [Klebsiella pneumoniae]HCJ3426123.1 host cell division inhibitor Icd-like protein [Klebsiella pneumoniae]